MKYRLLSAGGSVSKKLYSLNDARAELNTAAIAIITPRAFDLVEVTPKLDTDAGRLTIRLMLAGATREKIIAIVGGYGDTVYWSYHSLDSIVAEIWQSDLNSGEDADYWIINDICRTFNIKEVRE
jgi:hypothetical protein